MLLFCFVMEMLTAPGQMRRTNFTLKPYFSSSLLSPFIMSKLYFILDLTARQTEVIITHICASMTEACSVVTDVAAA